MPQDMKLSEICNLILIWQVFSPANVIFAGIGILLQVSILANFVWGHCNALISQAAKDVQASRDTLIDIFERIETFFRRLEIYTELPSTTEMMDTIVQVMVEVLHILEVATKQIKQGRMSKHFLYEYENVG